MDEQAIELARLREELKQAQHETDEILESTRDIEAQLEQDISQLEKELHDAMRKNKTLSHDLEDCKKRLKNAQVDHEKEIASVRDELAVMIRTHTRVRDQLRDEELKHDDLERQERILTTTYQDMENKYHESLEKVAVLESDLSSKTALEIENQRLKDEVRDLVTELTVARNRSGKVPDTSTRHSATPWRDPNSPVSDPDQSAQTKRSYFVNSEDPNHGDHIERPGSRLVSSRNSTRSEHPVYSTIEAMRAKLRQAKEYRSGIRPPSIVTPVPQTSITISQMSPRQFPRRTDRSHASRPPVSLVTRPATSQAHREAPNKDISRARRLSSGIPTPASTRRMSGTSPAPSRDTSRSSAHDLELNHLSISVGGLPRDVSPTPSRSPAIPVFATPAKLTSRRQSGIPSLSTRKPI